MRNTTPPPSQKLQPNLASHTPQASTGLSPQGQEQCLASSSSGSAFTGWFTGVRDACEVVGCVWRSHAVVPGGSNHVAGAPLQLLEVSVIMVDDV